MKSEAYENQIESRRVKYDYGVMLSSDVRMWAKVDSI